MWRVRTDKAGRKPTHARLGTGWLGHLRRSTPAAGRREEHMMVWVIDYTIPSQPRRADSAFTRPAGSSGAGTG